MVVTNGYSLSCVVSFLYQVELPPFLVAVQNDDVAISPKTSDHYLLQLTLSELQSLVPPNTMVFNGNYIIFSDYNVICNY